MMFSTPATVVLQAGFWQGLQLGGDGSWAGMAAGRRGAAGRQAGTRPAGAATRPDLLSPWRQNMVPKANATRTVVKARVRSAAGAGGQQAHGPVRGRRPQRWGAGATAAGRRTTTLDHRRPIGSVPNLYPSSRPAHSLYSGARL